MNEPSSVTNLFDQLRLNSAKQQPPQQQNTTTISSPDSEPNQAVSLSEPIKDGLLPEIKRSLVGLLRHGVVLATQKPKLFQTICQHQTVIQDYLANIYLKLLLDEKAGIGFIVRQDETDIEGEEANEEPVSLITRRTLSLYDTLLLLVLRKHYQERESAGEQRVIIDVERIEANLTPFLSLTNSTQSDRRKLLAALRKMIERHLISAVRGSDERFEITPIIRYVVNAEFLENMLEEYTQLSQKNDQTHERSE